MKSINNNKLVNIVALILLIIVSAFIYYIYVHNKGNNFSNQTAEQAEQNSEKANVNATITNHVDVFSGNEKTGVRLNIPGGAAQYFNDQVSTQSETYTTYTYQNFFRGTASASNPSGGLPIIKPRIRNVLTDLLKGYNYASSNTPSCLDRDQINVRYSNRVCNNNSRCLSEFGNRFINQNNNENFYEENPNVDYCTTSLIGSLSFNFRLNAVSGYVDNETSFLNIDYIACGTCAYDSINTDDNSFFIDNDLFASIPNELEYDYIPILENLPFQSTNIKQTFKISRYIYNGENSFKEDPQGEMGEIIYRPGNLYLMSQGTQTGIAAINNFSIPSGSNFDNPNMLRYIRQLQGTTKTSGIGAKCFVYNNTYKIIDCGENYLDSSSSDNSSSFITQIQDDDLQFVTITGAIISTGFSYRFKLKPKDGTSLSESVNWMLVPPTDLSPGKITKNTLLNQGSIRSFSRSTEISMMKIINNLKNSALPKYQNIVAGKTYIPLPLNSNVATITYTDGSQNIRQTINDSFNSVKSDFTGSSVDKNLNISAVSYNNNIYDNYPPYTFESTQSGVGADKDFLCDIEFNGKVSYFFIQNAAAFSNRVGNFIPGLGLVSGFDTITNGLQLASDFFPQTKKIPISTGGYSPLPTDISDPDVIINGTAVFTKRDAFLDILAFDSTYFNNKTLTNGNAATIITNIQTDANTKVSYRQMSTGILNTADVDQITYDGSCFSSLNFAQYLVDVNNDNFSLADGSCINGSGAKVYITFGGPANVPYGYVKNVLVESGGSNYSSGSYTLNASAISAGLTGTVKNLFFNITSENNLLGLKYEAVPQDSNGNVYNETNTSKGNLTNYGLIIGVSGTGTSIFNGGDGYYKGNKIYINQLDNNLNSLIGPSFDPEKITTERMRELPYITIIAPERTSKGSCLEPAQQNLVINDSNNFSAAYNFWEDSPGFYTPCPQQILLMDKTQREYLNRQGLSIQNGIKNILTSDTVEGFTTIENLKTIQFPDLNYRKDGTSANINGRSYLEIGRFIPYQTMTPPQFSGTENIPTGKGEDIWINYNWCQFIPYGVDNLYQKRFSSGIDSDSSGTVNFYKNLPTF